MTFREIEQKMEQLITRKAGEQLRISTVAEQELNPIRVPVPKPDSAHYRVLGWHRGSHPTRKVKSTSPPSK